MTSVEDRTVPMQSKTVCCVLAMMGKIRVKVVKSVVHTCNIILILDTTGDAGGPLVCRDGAGRHVLCGLVSWGLGCGRHGYYGVYTELAFFKQWIDEMTNLHQDISF